MADPNQDSGQVAALVTARDEDNNGDLFKINAVKLFMDGVLESVTAYLLQPYTAKQVGLQIGVVTRFGVRTI